MELELELPSSDDRFKLLTSPSLLIGIVFRIVLANSNLMSSSHSGDFVEYNPLFIPFKNSDGLCLSVLPQMSRILGETQYNRTRQKVR